MDVLFHRPTKARRVSLVIYHRRRANGAFVIGPSDRSPGRDCLSPIRRDNGEGDECEDVDGVKFGMKDGFCSGRVVNDQLLFGSLKKIMLFILINHVITNPLRCVVIQLYCAKDTSIPVKCVFLSFCLFLGLADVRPLDFALASDFLSPFVSRSFRGARDSGSLFRRLLIVVWHVLCPLTAAFIGVRSAFRPGCLLNVPHTRPRTYRARRPPAATDGTGSIVIHHAK